MFTIEHCVASRHTLGANFLKNGGSLRHLREILGDTNVKGPGSYLAATDRADEMAARSVYDRLEN